MIAFFLSPIGRYLAAPIGRYLAAAIGVVALVSGFALREQKKGAEKLAVCCHGSSVA